MRRIEGTSGQSSWSTTMEMDRGECQYKHAGRGSRSRSLWPFKMDPGFKGEFGEDLAARLEAENAPKQSEIKMEMEECLG
jgi:hypothetical protein